MNCPKCKKLLPDNVTFCTECGTPILQAEQKAQPEVAAQETVNPQAGTAVGVLTKMNNFIEAQGSDKLNKYLSLAAIIVAVLLRLLGVVLLSLAIAAVNSYLIFRNYKETRKIDKKMCIWSACALLIWLIMFL